MRLALFFLHLTIEENEVESGSATCQKGPCCNQKPKNMYEAFCLKSIMSLRRRAADHETNYVTLLIMGGMGLLRL